MDGIGVAFHAILAIMGGIATIGGGTAVLMRWLNPYRKMRQSGYATWGVIGSGPASAG